MMNRRRILQGAGLGMAAIAAHPAAFAAGWTDDAPPLAHTTAGPVSGYRSRRVLAFKGIPYGADTRLTRFQTPRPVAAWAQTKVCTEWAARAPQQSPDRAKANPVASGFAAIEGAPMHYHLPADQGSQSEDCLHLNIWTPALRDGKKRAVLFYIHGGAYNNGTANAELYDGTRLVERGDVVVVTVNHRLNAFGYLYLGGMPGLAGKYKDAGNVGMLDLVLALEWVRDNIAEFGGDKDRVTIFGQSGGGAKCATLMAMPAAKGLFHRVLTMSGQQVWAVGKAKATGNAQAALAAMGITGEVTAEKLEALTPEQIQTGARTTGNWLPVKDDVVLLRDPFNPDAPAMSSSIPMILGNTKDEVAGAQAWQRAGLGWETLPAELGTALEPFKGPYSADDIIKGYRTWYPAYRPVDVYCAAIAAFRSWPGQVIEAERRASHEESARRTWVYQMDFGTPTADGRSPHTIDLAFVFDNVLLAPGMVGAAEKDQAAAQSLATDMSAMLLRFAKTGDPNGAGLPRWPVYSLKDRETMLFDRVSKVVNDPRGQERRMMVGAKYRQPGT